MSDVTSSNEAAIDYALLEKVNPVFLTAKMTLFQLAANGDADAASLAENMGLTLEETQNSANTTASPEQRELIHYREVDATNYASLEEAVADIDGEVCITTEGLLMYFTDSEAGALCSNIRSQDRAKCVRNGHTGDSCFPEGR